MERIQGNHLRDASSAYLRSAREQPVNWREWGPESLAEARQQGKPILLNIGAVWSHWCGVMDHESYSDPHIAGLINDRFVPVRVDRDEFPELDARGQAAVSAISGQGGWPLNVFLTPEGKPFFGGTYFPAEERYGRPNFHHVLHSMASAFARQRDEVEESAASVMEAIEQSETFFEEGNNLDEDLLHRIIGSLLAQSDMRFGGFGSQPKFPHTTALELLIDTASHPGPLAAKAADAVKLSLYKMAAGGFHDQLAGGFHRYSVDDQWLVPHFEKMSYENSALLEAYTHAALIFGDPHLAKVAETTLDAMMTLFVDREHGGFYTSQNADAALDDDGAYYTWTRAEVEAAIDAEEFAVAERFYDLRPVGHMHSNPAKNVLHVTGEVGSLAAALAWPVSKVEALLTSARATLLAKRLGRPAPYLDRTMYSGWNGLCVSSFLTAGRALHRPDAIDVAFQTLDRVLDTCWDPSLGLSRVVAYGELAAAPVRMPAALDDYVHVGMACLDAWEHGGRARYLETAQQLADELLQRFYDPTEGGFFDMEQGASRQVLGPLTAKRKPLQDAPTPAGNPQAATLLLRLHGLTGRDSYQEAAETTLKLFAGMAEHLGLSAASYGRALRRLISPPVQV